MPGPRTRPEMPTAKKSHTETESVGSNRHFAGKTKESAYSGELKLAPASNVSGT